MIKFFKFDYTNMAIVSVNYRFNYIFIFFLRKGFISRNFINKLYYKYFINKKFVYRVLNLEM